MELCHGFWWTVFTVTADGVVTGWSRRRVTLSLNLMRRQEMSLQHSSDTPKHHTPAQPQVCGSIIDAEGREVPITEQMIQQACKTLEESRVEKAKKA